MALFSVFSFKLLFSLLSLITGFWCFRSSCDDGGWMSSACVCVLSVPGPVPDGVLSAVGDQAGRPDV